jgi:superkiller protein 3
MSDRWLFVLVSILISALVVGCAGRRIKRAPIETIPEDADTEAKIEMLEGMAVTYPEDAYVFYEIGNLYYEDLMPGEAMANYEKALALDPGLNKARVNMAMVLAESDAADSAKTLLEEAISIDPDDVKAYNNLGMIYYAELDVNTAVKYFSKALALDPVNAEARYNLGLAFAEGGLLLEAIREWRQILEISEETGEDSETVQRARLSLERAERQLKQ